MFYLKISPSSSSHGNENLSKSFTINENLNKYNMQAIDGIFVNEHEGAYLADKEKVEDILDSLASKYPELEIILTFGDKGAYYVIKI